MPGDADPMPAPPSLLEGEVSAGATINRSTSEGPAEAATDSTPTNKAPAEADTATFSNTPEPVLNFVIPSKLKKGSTRAKNPPGGKPFCPSQASTKRFASFHFSHF